MCSSDLLHHCDNRNEKETGEHRSRHIECEWTHIFRSHALRHKGGPPDERGEKEIDRSFDIAIVRAIQRPLPSLDHFLYMYKQ